MINPNELLPFLVDIAAFNDDTARQELDNYLKEKEIELPILLFHNWEDISYHGSPTWACTYCGLLKDTVVSNVPCTEAFRCLRIEAKRIAQEELIEYQKLKKMFETWEYLKNRYERKIRTRLIDRLNNNSGLIEYVQPCYSD